MKLLLRSCAVAMVVICATWAYRVNYATQEAMNRVADLEEAIAAEHEALAVLDAEWAYLNRPDRLRALVAENAATLGLIELTPDRFGDVAMVAYPPEPEPAPEPEAVAGDEGAPRPQAGAAPTRVAQAEEPAAARPAAKRAAPQPATRKPAAPKPTAPKPTARRDAPSSRATGPVTLQDLVNAVAGARP